MKTPNFFLILLIFLSSCHHSIKPQDSEIEINTNIVDMVFVEGDTFNMGSKNGDNDERPTHEVTLNSFYMDKYEVTFKAYDQFCEATNRQKVNDIGWGRGKHPIINIDWYDTYFIKHQK